MFCTAFIYNSVRQFGYQILMLKGWKQQSRGILPNNKMKCRLYINIIILKAWILWDMVSSSYYDWSLVTNAWVLSSLLSHMSELRQALLSKFSGKTHMWLYEAVNLRQWDFSSESFQTYRWMQKIMEEHTYLSIM